MLFRRIPYKDALEREYFKTAYALIVANNWKWNRKEREFLEQLDGLEEWPDEDHVPARINRFIELHGALDSHRERLKARGLSDYEIGNIYYSAVQSYDRQWPSVIRRRAGEMWTNLDAPQREGIKLLVLGILVFFSGLIVLYAIPHPDTPLLELGRDLFSNGWVTLIGFSFAVLYIDRAYKRREDETYLRRMIVQLRDPDPMVAYRSFSELVDNGLFHNGKLSGKRLDRVNLPRVRCSWIYLKGVALWSAQFDGADLYGINLRYANLRGASFRGAGLASACLKDADLIAADFSGADLRGAYMENAIWRETSEVFDEASGQFVLKESSAIFNEETYLPNGRKWNATVNMDEFTRRSNPGGFWEPQSPYPDEPLQA